MKHFNTKKGYTLVEIIIYASLFAILLAAIMNSSSLLTRSYRQIRTVKNTQMSALSAMDQMTRHIRQSESIDGSETVYGVAVGSLLLRSTDSVGVAHTVKFYLRGETVMMDKDGVLFGPLTDGKTTVTSLIFRQIDSGNSVGVKIELTLGGKNFYNTVMLRGSYN